MSAAVTSADSHGKDSTHKGVQSVVKNDNKSTSSTAVPVLSLNLENKNVPVVESVSETVTDSVHRNTSALSLSNTSNTNDSQSLNKSNQSSVNSHFGKLVKSAVTQIVEAQSLNIPLPKVTGNLPLPLATGNENNPLPNTTGSLNIPLPTITGNLCIPLPTMAGIPGVKNIPLPTTLPGGNSGNTGTAKQDKSTGEAQKQSQWKPMEVTTGQKYTGKICAMCRVIILRGKLTINEYLTPVQ